MQKVKILTHSGCDLTLPELQQLNISVIPDWLIFGDTQYRNHIDIHPDTFYTRLAQEPDLPTSAHPSPAEFMDAFQAESTYPDIIFIALSSKLTGTYHTAKIAAGMMEETNFPSRLHIFDSCQASFGAALLVLEAGKMAQSGACARDILDHLTQLVPRIGVYFIMDTLKYAYKGGRIGALRAVAAETLGLKPLLVFKDGIVKDLSLNRTFSEGIRSVYKQFRQQVGTNTEVILFHACNESGAFRLRDLLQKDFPHITPRIEVIGPVIGLYTGPGCVGIAFHQKEE